MTLEIAGINERLAAAGLARRIAAPRGDETDRDRIATHLLLALKELRDPGIVELLYRLSSPVLLTFCRARTRRSEFALDAQDLLEEVFLNLWLKCELFREQPGSTFTGWALAIAENHILQVTRRLRRERERVRHVAETTPRHRLVLDPARVAAAQEVIGRVRAEYLFLVVLCACALTRLPERSLHLLALRDREGLSYDAIAAHLEVSRANVGMWIRRARKRALDEVWHALKPGARRAQRT